MLITYFDEVKFEPDIQPHYWVAGLVADEMMIWDIETQLSALAEECFDNALLDRSTEFHAKDIFHRKANFKPWNELEKRLDVLKKIAKILDTIDGLGKIYVRINANNMLFADDYETKAFTFFVERVQMHLKTKKKPSILIGDRDNETVSTLFATMLSQFRRDGTPYAFGGDLDHLIDTVHFTHSHHSRMLQAADFYVWALQLCHNGDNGKYPRKEMIDFIRNETDLLSPSRYKIWPNQ